MIDIYSPKTLDIKAHQVSNHQPQLFDFFTPDGAHELFEDWSKTMPTAWYCNEKDQLIRAVRVPQDTSLMLMMQPALLTRHGVLVFNQKTTEFLAMQESEFVFEHNRCLSNGKRLCELDQSVLDQAKMLKSESQTIDGKLALLLRQGIFKNLLGWRRHKKERNSLEQQAHDIREHLEDLKALV